MAVRALFFACLAVVGFAGSATAASFNNVTVDRSAELYFGDVFLSFNPATGLSAATFGPSIEETGTGSLFDASLFYEFGGAGFVDIYDGFVFPPFSALAGPVEDLARSMGMWSFLFSDGGSLFVADLSNPLLPEAGVPGDNFDAFTRLQIFGAERTPGAEIPLPATVWLLIGALGALRLARFRPA